MERYYTLKEAAEIAKVSKHSVKEWLLRAGYRLPAGRRPRIPERILVQLLERSAPRLARV